jgi:hypothetical protein
MLLEDVNASLQASVIVPFLGSIAVCIELPKIPPILLATPPEEDTQSEHLIPPAEKAWFESNKNINVRNLIIISSRY